MTEQPTIVMAGTDEHDLTKLAEYQAVGGYEALVKARAMAPGAVIDELLASELRGRGGAFFPTAASGASSRSPTRTRTRTTSSSTPTSRSRAASRTTRSSSRVPHRFIEGCLITAHAVEAKSVYVYIRGEYLDQYEILVAALEEMRDRPEIRGDVTIVVHRGAGAYICGEETALLDSLEGKRGQPRTKPPFPAVAGPLRVADRRQQRRDDRHRPADHGDGRRRVREARRRELARHARSSRSPATSSAAATTRSSPA